MCELRTVYVSFSRGWLWFEDVLVVSRKSLDTNKKRDEVEIGEVQLRQQCVATKLHVVIFLSLLCAHVRRQDGLISGSEEGRSVINFIYHHMRFVCV